MKKENLGFTLKSISMKEEEYKLKKYRHITHTYIYIYIYIYIYLSIYLSIYLFFYQSIYLSNDYMFYIIYLCILYIFTYTNIIKLWKRTLHI